MSSYIGVYLNDVVLMHTKHTPVDPCVEHEVLIARLELENAELRRFAQDLNNKWYGAANRVKYLEEQLLNLRVGLKA